MLPQLISLNPLIVVNYLVSFIVEIPVWSFTEISQVRSEYCGPCMIRAPEIRLAHSCGSLVNCVVEHAVNIFPDKTELKTHVRKFKRRDLKNPKTKRKTWERTEQRIIDLLTEKAAWSVLRESCWYWGNISSEKVKSLLNGASPGTSLIRDSSDRR